MAKEAADARKESFGDIIEYAKAMKDAEGNTLLQVLVKEGKEELVRNIVEAGAELNCQNLEGYTPLDLAARVPDKGLASKMMSFLIEKGATPDGAEFLWNFLISFHDGEAPTPPQIHSLVESLASKNLCHLFNKTDESGNILLHCLVSKLEPQLNTLDLLYSNGVTFTQVDDNGESLLVRAIRGRRSLALISALIQRFQVTWKVLDLNGWSLLHHAAATGSPECLEWILDLGHLDVGAKCLDGDTPLHLAAGNVDEEVSLPKCKLLLKYGATVNIKNGKGQSAFDIAAGKTRTPLSESDQWTDELLGMLQPAEIQHSSDEEDD